MLNGLHKMLSRLFRPQVEADPRLVEALDRVDEAAAEFHRTLAAASPNVFSELQRALIQDAQEDTKRIRRARTKKREQ